MYYVRVFTDWQRGGGEGNTGVSDCMLQRVSESPWTCRFHVIFFLFVATLALQFSQLH